MFNRFVISYTTTVLLYISIGIGLWYMPQSQLFAKKKTDTKVIQLTLSTFVPPIITPKDTIKEEIAEPKEIIPEPIVEKIVEKKEIIKPKPVIKPKPIKKVIKKKIIKKVKKKRVKKRVKKRKSKSKTKNRKKSTKKSYKKRKVSPAKKSAFLAKIRRDINRYKSYPRVAKKRQMQGKVRAKFTLLRSGRVGKISLSGSRMFYSSAREAIKRAFPINAKKAPVSLPMSLNITLVYKIR